MADEDTTQDAGASAPPAPAPASSKKSDPVEVDWPQGPDYDPRKDRGPARFEDEGVEPVPFAAPEKPLSESWKDETTLLADQ